MKLTREEKWSLVKLTIGSIIIIVIFGLFAYNSENDLRRENGQRDLTLKEFFIYGGSEDFPTLKNVLLGATFAFVFGFIDNLFLVLGVDNLEKLFSGYSENVIAGIGNTYSDIIAAFLSSYISVIAFNKYGVPPFISWVDAIGVFFGCIVGILVPQLFI